MTISNSKRSTTINPAGSTKVRLHGLESKGGLYSRDTFLRDLKKVARKINGR